ncbi:DNA double-strand break repair nuclease NurA [Desulfotomaculum copahuensis]|uniref:NurA domain-containing protein n=1 Tax=Desulfotomaculum copahuensis TaxID=1838280 RepID=A0A1B7LHI0_9FIRM|nr:DNA double-strand break repair nuclease NurA [Desulfotomaculum copahuensis]OAT85749.1 hypothetical protein A6M21_04425 [Desulfotomaculum copahuensis]
MLLDENLVRELARLEESLTAGGRLPGRKALRRRLAERAGRLEPLSPMSPPEITAWFAGGSLAAVDGSVNSLGGAFPYVVEFFQALCLTSHGERAVTAEVFSPAVSGSLARVRELAAAEGLPGEMALRLLCNRRLSALELQAAQKVVREYRPRLMLFDGGFMRYLRHAPAEWESYCALAVERDVLSVGVIEEVESFHLAQAAGLEADDSSPDGVHSRSGVTAPRSRTEIMPDGNGRPSGAVAIRRRTTAGTAAGRPGIYDRELLFGLLEPGECLFTHPQVEVKNAGLYTVFARLSRHPQAVAVDFLCAQAGVAKEVMRYLYTITPAGSRGIPLFLDLVDAEVRLSHRDVRLLAGAGLDPAVRECFFTAQRQRRDY